jgi:hypothetical protein
VVNCYRAALALANRGIPVFPCVRGEKMPLTVRGFLDASDDPDVISAWFRQWPHANLAIATGLRSGLFVIDIDRKPEFDGLQTLAELEQVLGALPQTLTVGTWSGGEHRYFRMPPTVLRNSAKRLGTGLDTRGEGGYVLCPPSMIDGVPYRYSLRVSPADMPAQWVAALTPTARPTEAAAPWAPRDDRERSRAAKWCVTALQQEARDLAATPPGARNDRLWRSAAALGGLVHAGGIDVDDIRRALTWACSMWTERDPRKDMDTLQRGLCFGLAHPRQIQLGDVRAA